MLDLQYCNGQERYDFYNEAACYIEDFSPKAWRRAYVAALFTENKRWLTAIEKFQMLMPETRKNPKAAARDLAVKEYLQDQVSTATYEDRKAFYEAWRDTPCCADGCKDLCEPCSNRTIKFQSVPTFGLDANIRRYITRYGRYQTTSDLKEENDVRDSTVLSGVCDRKGNDDFIGNREQKRDGLFSEPAEVPGDQSEGVQKMLSSPFGEEMADRPPDQPNL